MLYIYRTMTLPNDILAIHDIEGAFDALSVSMTKHLHNDREVKDIIKEIDGSSYEHNVLFTKFGDTSITNCSSGCKAALLVYLYNLSEHVSKNGICYIDVVETGDNAIRVINRMSVDRDIYIHCNRVIPLDNEHGDIIFEGKAVNQNQMVGVMRSGS